MEITLIKRPFIHSFYKTLIPAGDKKEIHNVPPSARENLMHAYICHSI